MRLSIIFIAVGIVDEAMVAKAIGCSAILAEPSIKSKLDAVTLPLLLALGFVGWRIHMIH